MFLRTKILLSCIVLGLMLLISCNGSDGGNAIETDPTDEATAESEQADVSAGEAETEVPTATPEPTVVPTPTPTPIPAAISLSTANVELGGAADPLYLDKDEIVFDEVSMPEDGWLVIWPDTSGSLSAEQAHGYIAVDAGVQEKIGVEIDLADIQGEAIQVALHSGRTADGDFVADADNLILIQALSIDTPASRPMIETSATFVTNAGFLDIDLVQSDGPGWVAVYAEDGVDLLGFTSVDGGQTADVSVPVQWQIATTDIQVRLLQDLGNVGEFESEIDEPALFQGEAITLDLSVGLPFEIVVFDQPMPDSIIVNRITTPIDGYVVVFGDPDENGFPDTILGSAPISAGVSEYVEVDIENGSATDQILMSLFTDSNGSGEFDFPEDDPVLAGVDAPARKFVPVRSTIEGLLVVDQFPTADMLKVSLVATPRDSWLVVEKVVESDDTAEAIPPVAQLRLEPGLHYNLDISLDGVTAGDVLKVMLYTNNPEPELFEPERNDFPLQADERQVFVTVVVQ